MNDQTLAGLRARVAKLEAQPNQSRSETAQRRLAGRRQRKAHRLIPLALATLLMALVPLSLLAANPVFSDLNQAAPVHRPNIQALGDAGITTGVDDPASEDPNVRLYLPNDLVTREQMATFLARTAGLGGNPPVVNAKDSTHLGGQPAGFYQPAGQPIMNANNAAYAASAGTANTVLGYAPNGLVRATGASAFAPITVGAAFDNQATVRWTPMLTTDLTAPGAGYVLVTASINADGVDAACNGASGTACTFNARLWDGGAAVSPWISTVVNNNGNRYGSVTVSYLFPVAAGSRTMTLEASTDAAFVSKIKGFNATMTALFIPFNGTGTTP